MGKKQTHKIYSAYDAVIKNNENLFYKFKTLELDLKRDFNNKWKFKISCGVRYKFNGELDLDTPIPFIVFSSSKGDEISRVPISIVSLLETTAIYSEFEFLTSETNKLKPKFRDIQLHEISKSFEDILYDSESTIYSAAVHIVSNNLNITAPIEGYKASSLFAKIALNLPSKLFDKIKLHNEVKLTEEWERRSRKMLENHDRGFAFYLLVRNYADFKEKDASQIIISDILEASSLPDEKKVLKLIDEEILELDEKMLLLERSDTNRMVTEKVFKGTKFRRETGLAQQKTVDNYSIYEEDGPHLLFTNNDFKLEHLDLKLIQQKVVKQMPLTRGEWFIFFSNCNKRIDDFNSICGI